MSSTLRRTSLAITLGLLALAPLASAEAAKKVLRLRIDGPLLEAPNDAAGLMALFNEKVPRSLREVAGGIRSAAKDTSVGGLVLILEQPQVNLAQIEELTAAVQAFKAKGKPVYAYLDEGNNATYALAASADHVTLAENSSLEIIGLHGSLMFFKGLFDKIGVEADMMHVGAYKSALEPFTRTEPSPEAAENINWLLDGMYGRWIQLIADGRKLSPEDVRKLVDQAPLSAQQALDAKLIDEIGTFNGFAQRIEKEFGKDVEVLKKYSKEKSGPELDMQNPFAIFNMLTELMQGAQQVAAPQPAVGLIYINGAIVVGESQEGPFGGGGNAGSTTIRAALEKARTDENIRAVVLRVDSPGGSALASDIIWTAARRLGQEKPLIVSMGGVAGSGGYYVAVPGDTIFADATTITGSIGVVSGKLVLSGLFEDKLGITTTEFNRGKHAGLMSAMSKWDESERKWMADYMNEVYEQFKQRIQTSRGDRIKGDLESMAGGRVFTGEQALERGLVDKLGGLTEALDFAASKAGLSGDYPVQVLPKPSGIAEFFSIFEQLAGKDGEDEFEIAVRAHLGADPLMRALLPLLKALAPEQAAEILRTFQNLSMLNREHVGCFMPAVPQIR